MWTSFKEGDSYSCIILIILSSVTYISQGTRYLSFHEVKQIHDVQKVHVSKNCSNRDLKKVLYRLQKKSHKFRILNVF